MLSNVCQPPRTSFVSNPSSLCSILVQYSILLQSQRTALRDGAIKSAHGELGVERAATGGPHAVQRTACLIPFGVCLPPVAEGRGLSYPTAPVGSEVSSCPYRHKTERETVGCTSVSTYILYCTLYIQCVYTAPNTPMYMNTHTRV